MRKHLVLVGGGHAHMMVLEGISRFVEKEIKVTVIGPSDYHYYSGMGPGMLGRTYAPEEIRFATQKVVRSQGGVFIRDYVDRIDPEAKQVFTRSGHAFDYDLLSCNAGSQVPVSNLVVNKDESPDSEDTQSIYPVKPIEKLMEASEKLELLFLQKRCVVSVVGGGPSSAEIAGNVWQLAKRTGGQMPRIAIFAGKRFMARFPESIRSRIMRDLEDKNVEINETGYVSQVEPDQITLESGKIVKTDFTFMALGVKPSPIFEESGIPVGPDRGLLVNDYLQSVQYPEIFGGGDCISFQSKPLDKVGVYAVRQNPVLLNNLLAFAQGDELKPFDPGPDYLLIFNTGGGKGVLKKRSFIFSGRLAFWVKDYIDRRFMGKFQAIEKGL